MFANNAAKMLPPAPERVRFDPNSSYSARLKANLTHEESAENARKTDASIAPSSPRFIAGRNLLKQRKKTPHGGVEKPIVNEKKRDATNRTPLAEKDVRATKKTTAGSVPKGSECRNLLQVFSQPLTQDYTKIGKQPDKENCKNLPVKPKRKPPQPERGVPLELQPDYQIEQILKRPTSMTEEEIIESMGERQYRKERASMSPTFHQSFDSAEYDFQQDLKAEKEKESKDDGSVGCDSKASTVPPGYEVDLKAAPLNHGMTEEQMMSYLEKVGERDGVGDQYARDFFYWNDRKPKPCDVLAQDSPDSECEYQRWKTERDHDEWLKAYHEEEMSKKKDEEYKKAVEKEHEDEPKRTLDKGANMYLKIGVDSLVQSGLEAGKKKQNSPDSQAGPGENKTDPFQFVRGISRQPFKSKANITFVDGTKKGMSDKPKQPPPKRDVEVLLPKPRRVLTEEEEEKRQQRIERVQNRGNLITKEAISSQDRLIQSIAGYIAREVKAKMKNILRENPESIEVLLGGAPPETKARKEAFKDLLLTAVQKKRKNDAAAAAREEKKRLEQAAKRVEECHGGAANTTTKKGGKKSKGRRVTNSTAG